ncbi:MAG: hypothetical protein IKX31_03265 [Muribaculaceae bacterium]|nr:hypothetical protein [Muribaculaceae bacterium]
MKKLFNYLSVVALLMLTACNGATFITPDKDAVSFAIDGDEESVNISADGSWSISECPEWVTTEVQDSVLTIKTAKNETGAVREGDIILSGKEGVNVKIKVTQAAKCTHITPASDKVEFEKEGGTQTVNIDTDGLPQVEAPEGFTATYAAGVLTINTPANEEGVKNGEIKLTCEDQSATIAVSQKGNVCPKCNGTGKIKCPKCHGRGYTSYGGADAAWGCKSCGGRGYEGEGMDLDDCLVRGSGRIRCPQCGGSGR